jgi:ribonucleoside-diphosphate reductase alpha subunit
MASIDTIAADLTIDFDYIEKLIAERGFLATAKHLGYDIYEPDHMLLAGRMLMMHHNLSAPKTIEEYVEAAKEVLSQEVRDRLLANRDSLSKLLEEPIHLNYDWFSANTFINNYLLSCGETVQLCFLRVAVQLYSDLKEIEECYRGLAERRYVVASPCFFNAGTVKPQMSSCFLHTMGDSTESITRTWSNLALTSKYNGGNGVDLSLIRHSEIGKIAPNIKWLGMSKGVIPIAQVINHIIRLFDQGGKRKGTATLFLRPHHIDVYEFCELGLKTGDIYLRAHDVNIALWCSWLFFDRVRRDMDWTLFCPNYTPELNECYGEEFNRRYLAAEARPLPSHAKRVVKARDLYRHIVQCQLKSSMPYILHGDAANLKSNQRYMGYIRCANLCLEIVEFSSPDKIASCNLSSISLRAFASSKGYDYRGLAQTARLVTRNIDSMIDSNWYPIPQIGEDNKRDRPLSIGVSGFAETLHELDLAFEDEETLILNKRIFACIYFNALAESVQLAIANGPHKDFDKSPLANGLLQFDLWAQEYRLLREMGMEPLKHIRAEEDDTPIDPKDWGQEDILLSNGYLIEPSWDSLRSAIVKYGVRNSLLIGLMPTGTSSQVLMNAETVEAHQSNIYSRKLDKGAYPVVNKYLTRDLKELGLWTKEIIKLIQSSGGSVQSLPFTLKKMGFEGDMERLKRVCKKYKTMYEIPQKRFLKLAADRGRYVCQSQSTNVYLQDPTVEQLEALHMYGMMLGLKTGMYYLRTSPATEPMKFCLSCSS